MCGGSGGVLGGKVAGELMQRNQTGREDVIIGAGLYCFGVIDMLSYLIGSEMNWGSEVDSIMCYSSLQMYS